MFETTLKRASVKQNKCSYRKHFVEKVTSSISQAYAQVSKMLWKENMLYMELLESEMKQLKKTNF